MKAIAGYLEEVNKLLGTVHLSDLIDILLVAYLVYRVLILIRTTSTARIAKAIVLVLIVAWLTELLKLHTINFIISKVLEIGILALVILFQPELRRAMEHVGSKNLRGILSPRRELRQIDQVIGQTVAACEIMSREKVGALIVFERSARLDEFFKTGTVLDARVSEQLLRNLFFPKASLHDGAVIIRNERVAAAGCVLPLTDNSHLSSDLGTRHRAGIGVSEVTDAVVVIVSEETGTISVAIGGMLKRHLAAQTLERLLHNELAPETEAAQTGFWMRLLQHLPGSRGDNHGEK